MAHTISLEVKNLFYTEDGTFSDGEVWITTPMNLSEEFATTAAQYALSTELGCDLDTVLEWETDADDMGGTGETVISFRNPDLEADADN